MRLEHPSVKLKRTRDYDFLNGLLPQLANVGLQGAEIDESGLNFMLPTVKGI